jgi:beta-glucanase (GH16 family)
MHGKGATASGAPKNVDWTRYMQSSCYQHGNNHNKAFSALDKSVNAADNFNVYEVTWTSTKLTIKVNGKTARTMTGTENIPQKPLFVRLHARSIGYSDMKEGSKFSSYIEEFQFEPAPNSSIPVL